MKHWKDVFRKRRVRVGIILGLIGIMLSLIAANYLVPRARKPRTSRSSDSMRVIAEFPANFYIGIANAPAQVEEFDHDAWGDFAERGRVTGWKNQPRPKDRIMFFSRAEEEIDLAAQAGVTVLRMGVDWGRLAPKRPGTPVDPADPEGDLVGEGIQDRAALERYKAIIAYAKGKGIRVMLCLFHHSLPLWSQEEGGWTNPETADHFIAFSNECAREFGRLVDDWLTFNEPNVFLLMTYVAGNWPPGLHPDYTGFIDLGAYKGQYAKAFDQIIRAHRRAYEEIKLWDTWKAWPGLQAPSRVGIAHFVSQYYAYSPGDIPMVFASENLKMVNDFPDSVQNYLDFLGINYYGEEVVKGTAIAFLDDREYSDSGRSIYPEGLYKILVDFNKRYNGPLSTRKSRKPLAFAVTENGISDEDDIFRPSYLIEHLLAVRKAMDKGVPVEGYVFWTLSDNFEWADGYAPKFGLVAVDREHGLARQPRESFYLFRQIAETKRITQGMRDMEWSRIQVRVGSMRKLYRAPDGFNGLDEPRYVKVSDADWRFPDEPSFDAWTSVRYFMKRKEGKGFLKGTYAGSEPAAGTAGESAAGQSQ